MEKVSIIIACYNEEKSIPELINQLDKLPAITQAADYSYEFVFVDDGSSDKTKALLQDKYKNHSNIKIVSHEHNSGYGAAIRTGMRAATGNLVLCYDGDCTTPVEDIPKMLGLMTPDVDIVSGSAFHPEGNAGKVLWYRLILSKTLVFIYKTILGRAAAKITSFTLSFRLYRKNILENIHFRSDNFVASAELLILCLLKGCRVVEYPTTLSERKYGKSKMKVLPTVFQHVKFIFKIIFRRKELLL
jgi:dolichol-phosphate mannosyltransferase